MVVDISSIPTKGFGGTNINLFKYTERFTQVGIIYSSILLFVGLIMLLVSIYLTLYQQEFAAEYLVKNIDYENMDYAKISFIFFPNVNTLPIFVISVAIFWLVMSCIMKEYNNSNNVDSSEKLAKDVNYIIAIPTTVSFAVCIIYVLIVIVIIYGLYIMNILNTISADNSNYFPLLVITVILTLVLLGIFSSIRIHGIRTHRNGLIKAYLVFQYVMATLTILLGLGSTIVMSYMLGWGVLVSGLIVMASSIQFFIMDIGFTIILYSIRIYGVSLRLR